MMRSDSSRVLTVWIGLALAVVFASPANALEYSTTVHLSVAADSAIQSRIESFLSRELRDLQGVRVVDERADWWISVVAVYTGRGGASTGYAISTTLIRPAPVDYYAALSFTLPTDLAEIADSLGHIDGRWLRAIMARVQEGLVDLGEHMTTYLHIGPLDNLKSVCQEIVADIDREYLEPKRLWFQEQGNELDSFIDSLLERHEWLRDK